MTSLILKRFSQFAWGHDNTVSEVWVNPTQVAYVSPRMVTRGKCEQTDGTLLYFQQEAGALAVREPVGLVIASLQGRGGICRDCYQPLRESWMSVCEHRRSGVDEDYEAACADVLP